VEFAEMKSPSHEHATTCPFCGRDNDMALNAPQGGKRPKQSPKDGDLSFCIGCGEWSVFAEGEVGGLRKPNGREYLQIGLSAEIAVIREAWVQTKAKKPEGPKIKGLEKYQCDACGETYISGWSEGEAEAKYRQDFGKPLDHDRAVVLCEDCYARALAEIGKFESRH